MAQNSCDYMSLKQKQEDSETTPVVAPQWLSFSRSLAEKGLASFALRSASMCNSTKQIIALHVILAGLSPHCFSGGHLGDVCSRMPH